MVWRYESSQYPITSAELRSFVKSGALRSFAEIAFPIYISAFSLGQLLFQFINQAFPDPAARAFAAESIRQAIRWPVASLIVAFPVFLGMARLITRDLSADPAKRGSKVRRWLTYVTLFVAASVLIGDVTTLVYHVLGGELTVRFLLKVLTVGSIAGTAFWYYLSDLQRDEREVGS